MKRYVAEIRKFLVWCRKKTITTSIPLPASIVSLYIFEMLTQEKKHASMLVMSHAALKWFHSFTPGGEPFGDSCCYSIIECARRSRDRPIVKKEAITTEVIKKIIDRYTLEGASAMELRISALCSLGFAVWLR